MKEIPRLKEPTAIKAFSTGIKVKIENSVWKDMFGWCRAANTECSGYGLVKQDEKGDLLVHKVFLPEQQCSTGYTTILSEATARLEHHLLSKKNINYWEVMRLWWHTHYNFDTFWSETDDKTAQEFSEFRGNTWGLSIVINQAGDYKCRIDMKKPFDILVDDIPIEIVPDNHQHTKHNYKADIRKWIKPFPLQKHQTVVWTKEGSIYKAKEKVLQFGSKYIIFAGKLMTKDNVQELINCPCGDQTCIDCKAILGEKTNVAS